MYFSTILLAALPIAALAMPAANPPVLTFSGGSGGGSGGKNPSPGHPGGGNGGGGHNDPHPTISSTSKGGHETTPPHFNYYIIDSDHLCGSGCNAGSVAGAISSDAQTITLLYDSFIAQAGPGITPSEGRKNCQLNVQLLLPQGWQFSVFKADYRGYAFLQSGDKGVVKATYYFFGDSTQISSQLDLNGAYDDNYLKTDEFGLESTVWSPCGEEGLLNINSEVRVTPLNTTNTALLTVDSTDLSFEQIHYLQWQTC